MTCVMEIDNLACVIVKINCMWVLTVGQLTLTSVCHWCYLMSFDILTYVVDKDINGAFMPNNITLSWQRSKYFN